MKAFSNFKEIDSLPAIEDKQRAWLRDYEGLFFGIGENGNDMVNWSKERDKYVYSDKRFGEPIICIDMKYRSPPNKIQRHPQRLVIEFDEERDKAQALLEQVKTYFIMNRWGFIQSSHNSVNGSDYLQIEFNRKLSDDESKKFLILLADKFLGKIDYNFASSNRRFPVLYAVHWKYPKQRELPILFVEGKQIDYDSLIFDKPKGNVISTFKNGEPYENYQTNENSETNKSLIVIPANELKKTKKPKNFIIDTLIYPKDIVMYSGDSNSYKSLITLYEAIIISKGKLLFDKFRTKRTNVLILSLENSPFVDGSRITAICRGLGIRTPKNLYFISRKNDVDLQKVSFQNSLMKVIRENNIGIMYIDTINPATPDLDDNAVRDVQKVFAILFKIGDNYNISIKFLIHTGKDKKSYLGSAKWKANSDSLIYCDRHKDQQGNLSNEITLSNEKNRWGENDNLKIAVHSEKRNNDYYRTWFKLLELGGQGRPRKAKLRKIDKTLKRIIELVKEKPRPYSELLAIILKEGICNEKTFKSARSIGVNSMQIKLNERSLYEVCNDS